jgi:hypothetical protein
MSEIVWSRLDKKGNTEMDAEISDDIRLIEAIRVLADSEDSEDVLSGIVALNTGMIRTNLFIQACAGTPPYPDTAVCVNSNYKTKRETEEYTETLDDFKLTVGEYSSLFAVTNQGNIYNAIEHIRETLKTATKEQAIELNAALRKLYLTGIMTIFNREPYLAGFRFVNDYDPNNNYSRSQAILPAITSTTQCLFIGDTDTLPFVPKPGYDTVSDRSWLDACIDYNRFADYLFKTNFSIANRCLYNAWASIVRFNHLFGEEFFLQNFGHDVVVEISKQRRVVEDIPDDCLSKIGESLWLSLSEKEKEDQNKEELFKDLFITVADTISVTFTKLGDDIGAFRDRDGHIAYSLPFDNIVNEYDVTYDAYACIARALLETDAADACDGPCCLDRLIDGEKFKLEDLKWDSVLPKTTLPLLFY